MSLRVIQEQRLVGERRSGIDRRSMSVSSAEEFARKVQSDQGLEQKLDLLARMTLEIRISSGCDRTPH
jgi:hypothetical protein